MPKHIHEGHRERMRTRIEKNGIMNLQPHEVLEYMLYSFVPRKDTNELAHRLMSEFGSFSNVLNASPEFLREISGMTENAALFLSALPDIFHLYLAEVNTNKTDANKPLKPDESIRTRMGSLLYGCAEESVCIAALDYHEKVLACEIIETGERSEVRLDPKTVVNYAQKHRAYGILLAHNHPNGNTNPSTADMSLTYDIYTTLNSLGYRLLDHYIFHGNDFYSFKEHNQITYFKNLYDKLKEDVWTK